MYSVGGLGHARNGANAAGSQGDTVADNMHKKRATLRRSVGATPDGRTATPSNIVAVTAFLDQHQGKHILLPPMLPRVTGFGASCEGLLKIELFPPQN